jgi:NADH-quinone oxidoreductase subunit H
MSVPWTVKEGKPFTGLAGFAASIGVGLYNLFGPVLSRFSGAVFLGGVVLVVVVVWAHSLIFSFVDGMIAHELNAADVTTVLGGELTISEGKRILGEHGVPGVAAYPLWFLQFEIVRDVIGMLAVLGFISVIPLYAIWWERKVSGHIQSRPGPMRTGGWHGWSQSLADGIKLIGKEDLVPAGADGLLFRLAPYVAFVPAILAFFTLPFGMYWAFRYMDIGLVFILAMLGVEVVGVILAGWASNNKWSVYGAMREACQMVSYEIPLGMALLLPVMTVGTLNMVEVGNTQSAGWFSWIVFQSPLLFITSVVYYIATLASCKRAPFDLPESESELVAGFLTEYSGFRWSLFFFAEYAAMFVVSGLQVILFFGAWHSPLPAAWGEALLAKGIAGQAIHGILFQGPLWFIGKCTFLIYVQMWIRWTLPRIRIDQVLYVCVQVMLPMMMVLLLGHTFWLLWVGPETTLGVISNWVLGGLGLFAPLGFIGISLYGFLNRRQLVGSIGRTLLPGS